jgi:hypothetical protein
MNTTAEDRAQRKVFIAAESHDVAHDFCRRHGLPLKNVVVIRREIDVQGRDRSRPLFLLPGFHHNQPTVDAVHMWEQRLGGRVVRVSEACMRGDIPFCANDTDGDGDCHLCARSGGCAEAKRMGSAAPLRTARTELTRAP